MIISKNGVNYELKGSPWYLDNSKQWIYFPAQMLLINWKESCPFSHFYDEDTSEQQLDSWHKLENVIQYTDFYDMKLRKDSFDALRILSIDVFNQGRDKVKDDFRKLIT